MGIKEYLKEKFGDAYTSDIDTEVGKQIGADYVPKHVYAEQGTKLKNFETQATDQAKQLDELKKSAGDNAKLQEQIETFKADNAAQKENHDRELQALRFNYALDSALTKVGAKSVKAVKGLLDASKLSLDGENIIGLKEQIDEVKKSDAFLFEETKEPGPGGNPLKPGEKAKPERPKGQVFL